MLKRTALFSAHQKLNARLIEFGGWEMPIQYTSITDEHLAVRQTAGLFDISHMGEILVTGHRAAVFLNQTLTNDIRKLEVGHGQYTLMCNKRGGVIDDLYAYRTGANEYLLVINASRIEPDIAWLKQQLENFLHDQPAGAVVLGNVSELMGAIAVQGPCVGEFINQCFPGNFNGGMVIERVTDLKKNQIARLKLDEAALWISRTGYTGEDGFEIVAPAEIIEAIWNKLFAAGQRFGLKPCGLGARDTLRTEVCYPLYGHELDENTTPIEAGVGFFVALEKGEFIGRSVLAEQKISGTKKKLVAFKMTEKSAPPRPHYPIWINGKSVGLVVSGTQSPSLNLGIGMGYAPAELAKPDTKIEIEIRGKRFAATIVPKPIYK